MNSSGENVGKKMKQLHYAYSCVCCVPQFMFIQSVMKYLKNPSFENKSCMIYPKPSNMKWGMQLWWGYYWVHNTDGQSRYIEQMGIVFITVFNWPSPDNTR